MKPSSPPAESVPRASARERCVALAAGLLAVAGCNALIGLEAIELGGEGGSGATGTGHGASGGSELGGGGAATGTSTGTATGTGTGSGTETTTTSTTNTSPAVCGDGQVSGGEPCDGSLLEGQSCMTQGFGSGTLGCASDCSAFDTSGCADPATRHVQYAGFACNVFAASRVKALDNDDSNLAYDVNVTRLSSSLYAAVFHAEPYRKSPGCWGDSVAVRYAASPDGPFGPRTGDCDTCPGDQVISRTTNASAHMSSADCTGLGALSGGGNPMLIKRNGSPEWALFYLAVSDYDEPSGTHNGWWRHYLMLAEPTDVANMATCDWAALARNASAQDYWHWFSGAPPVWQAYNPWPARNHSSGTLLQSAYTVYQSADTNGLIGNVSYNEARDRIYFFYNDYEGTQPVTMRRETFDLSEVNWWLDPIKVRDGWMEVALHAGLGRWMVLSLCLDAQSHWDLCMQFTPSANPDEIAAIDPNDQASWGLRLSDTFHDAVTLGVMEQYGYLKNEYGQIADNDFRLYVGERSPGLYGMDTYSVRVVCF